MSLFPVVQPEAAQGEPAQALPIPREIKWDLTEYRPVFRHGEPVIAEGLEAIAIWAWHALQTVRFRHEIYSWGYGCEVESLIGQPCTGALKQAEARRYVREALITNPHIRDVVGISVDFTESVLTIGCILHTAYGESEVSFSA